MTGVPEGTTVAVAGGGMAGLVAAVRALEGADDVVVFEKGPRPGGSMALSNGEIWTYDSVSEMRDRAPEGDPALQALIAAEFGPALEWLSGTGADLEPADFDIGSRRGVRMDPAALTETLVEVIEDRGGTVHLETPLVDLVADGAGGVGGLRVGAGEGVVTVGADAVVLATGGFQGDETLVEQFVTDHADSVWLRANPWSTGDGLDAARGVGARTTGGMGTFYGHNMPAPPAEIGPDSFTDVTQVYDLQAHPLALDREGRRFTDEAASTFEHTLAQDTAKRAGGTAYYVLDGTFLELDPGIADTVSRAEECGGRVARAGTLPGLGDALSAWGVDGNRAVGTIRGYNEAIRDDDDPDPPRSADRRTFDTPPFHAVETWAGITVTGGGIDVSRTMGVRRRAANGSALPPFDGERAERTVPGLYAAGADVGGIHERGYVGGLAVALVTGYVAGAAARPGSP